MMNNKYDLTNIDHVWELHLTMWRWIKQQVQDGNRDCVRYLKHKWMENNWDGDSDIISNCFFCHYNQNHEDYVEIDGKGNCDYCPGVDVDKDFDCEYADVNYTHNPVAFWELSEKLDERRK